MNDALRAAFDPELYRRLGHETVDRLADYLMQALNGTGEVVQFCPPAEMRLRWELPSSVRAPEQFMPFVDRLIAESLHNHHPRCFGHQVSAPAPLGALVELAVATLNNSLAVRETGPVGPAIEDAVVTWLAKALGFSDEAGGIIVSGGSIGNLTALLAARQSRSGQNVWEAGTLGGPPPAVLVSEQCHHSIARAAQIMGWGSASIVPIACDEKFRVDRLAIAAAREAALRDGREIIALVGNAGSTAVGAFDPLDELADVAAEHGWWFHVDAAHGGGAALSPRHRHLVRGIERADSVVVDFHKMLLCPSLCTAVLFRRQRDSFNSFGQQAAYLFRSEGNERAFDLALRTVECTKPLLGARVWALLAVHGADALGAFIAGAFDLAAELGAMLECAGFELATRPQANIVCLRRVDSRLTPERLDVLHSRVRQQLVASGRFFFVETKLRGRVYCRVTLMNPFTTRDDLRAFVDALVTAFDAGGSAATGA